MGRWGVTMVELLVVIAILGLIVGMSGFAFTSLRAPRASERTRALRAARAHAIREGKPVALPFGGSRVRPSALFLPDGRAIGTGVNPLTGVPTDASQ
jgi:prepilin-type N-terminal cleavage/methylation domain-containing protein